MNSTGRCMPVSRPVPTRRVRPCARMTRSGCVQCSPGYVKQGRRCVKQAPVVVRKPIRRPVHGGPACLSWVDNWATGKRDCNHCRPNSGYVLTKVGDRTLCRRQAAKPVARPVVRPVSRPIPTRRVRPCARMTRSGCVTCSPGYVKQGRRCVKSPSALPPTPRPRPRVDTSNCS